MPYYSDDPYEEEQWILHNYGGPFVNVRPFPVVLPAPTNGGCPICHRVMCDHTPAERGQTMEEMLAQSRPVAKPTKPNKGKKKR